jgi:hypothetical protein
MNSRNSRHPVLVAPVLSVIQVVAGVPDVECDESPVPMESRLASVAKQAKDILETIAST